jgi:hypothetical protein
LPLSCRSAEHTSAQCAHTYAHPWLQDTRPCTHMIILEHVFAYRW